MHTSRGPEYSRPRPLPSLRHKNSGSSRTIPPNFCVCGAPVTAIIRTKLYIAKHLQKQEYEIREQMLK